MKFFTILISILFVNASGLNKIEKKKLKRGVKIFGKDANPLNFVTECSCRTISNCWLVGDPHLKSFFDKFEKVEFPKGEEFDIYTHDNFCINATTYGPDIMDNINFGHVHTWHIDDCNNKEGWLEDKSHEYSDGSTLHARVYCRKLRKKMHINLLLTKTTSLLDNNLNFEEYEDFIESSGVCINKK